MFGHPGVVQARGQRVGISGKATSEWIRERPDARLCFCEDPPEGALRGVRVVARLVSSETFGNANLNMPEQHSSVLYSTYSMSKTEPFRLIFAVD